MRTKAIVLLSAVGACVVIVVLGGRSERHQEQPGAGQRPPLVEVITDPAAITEARKLAEIRREERLADLLNNPQQVSLYDTAQMELLRAEKTRSLPALRRVLKSSVPENRAAAAVLLVKLGDEAGRAALAELFGDASARLPLLSRLGDLEEEQAGQWPEVQTWVLQRLNDSDEQTRRAAVSAVMRLDITEANPGLSALATQSGGDPDGWIASCAAGMAPSMELLEAIIQRLESGKDARERYWLVLALQSLIGAPDPAVSQRAVEVAAGMLETPARNDYYDLAILSAVAERGGDVAVGLLRRLCQSPERPQLRGEALVALAKLEPQAQLPVAVKALADEKLRSYGAEVIGEIARGTQDHELIEKLADAAGREKAGSSTLEVIADAMLKVGGDDGRSAVESLVPRLPPWSVRDIRWKLGDMTEEKAADRLVSLGLFDRATADRALVDLHRQNREDPDSNHGLIGLFDAAGILLGFDVETGELPVGHDQLILDFAAKSAGAFAPEAVIETWNRKHPEDYEADYTVQFIHGQRLYRFAARNLGDWYDLEAVVAAIHTALADAGVTKRFHQLGTSGQFVEFVFAEATVMDEVSRRFGLPLNTDLGQAEREGKQSERELIELLEKQGRIVEEEADPIRLNSP